MRGRRRLPGSGSARAPATSSRATPVSMSTPATMSASVVNSRSQCETPSTLGMNSMTDGATVFMATESWPAMVWIRRAESPRLAATLSASSRPASGKRRMGRMSKSFTLTLMSCSRASTSIFASRVARAALTISGSPERRSATRCTLRATTIGEFGSRVSWPTEETSASSANSPVTSCTIRMIFDAATRASCRSAMAVAPVWDCSPSTSMSSFWVYQLLSTRPM